MNNSAAIGYMISAMQNLDYSNEQIRKMEREMDRQMDFKTEDEAEQIYQRF